MGDFFEWALGCDSPEWVAITLFLMLGLGLVVAGILTVYALQAGFWLVVTIWFAAPAWLLRRAYIAARTEGGDK